MDEITVPLKMDLHCVPLKLRWISPGQFKMGDRISTGFDDWTDTPIGEFEVSLTKGYWIGIYPVTQCQWQSVMGTNPSFFKGSNKPVEEISWDDALDFCHRLDTTQLSIPTGYVFSLPTEAQWEFACRGGTTFRYQISDAPEDLSRVAWHKENSPDEETQDVGQKEPNRWGLYDMLGNVREWCFDSPVDYPEGTTQVDWFGAVNKDNKFLSENRIVRGGAAGAPPDSFYLTCSGRAYGFETHPYTGFRLCLRYGELR